ncbi:MAG TPA: lysogenization regulator HflD [Thiotrichales bacterium]|nr:lysogenization regulator HflD [Thiotrichales bacterium]
MTDSLRDRTLALAALFQACGRVAACARHGAAADREAECLVHSILQQDAPSTEAVYGGVTNLRPGLRLLVQQLSTSTSPAERDMELARYVITVMVLERKLARRPALMERVAEGIERVRRQQEHFELTHPTILASLADIYQQTVSTLNPRVMVKGEPNLLANPDNAAFIRAMLLAAIRAAVLWHQKGGRRRHLLLKRRGLLESAERLLVENPA